MNALQLIVIAIIGILAIKIYLEHKNFNDNSENGGTPDLSGDGEWDPETNDEFERIIANFDTESDDDTIDNRQTDNKSEDTTDSENS